MTGRTQPVGRGVSARRRVAIHGTRLLDLGEVVLRVLVKDHLSDGAQRELLVWPDLGQIEDVVAELLGLLSGHGLL